MQKMRAEFATLRENPQVTWQELRVPHRSIRAELCEHSEEALKFRKEFELHVESTVAIVVMFEEMREKYTTPTTE